jgi:hypothetical protein
MSRRVSLADQHAVIQLDRKNFNQLTEELETLKNSNAGSETHERIARILGSENGRRTGTSAERSSSGRTGFWVAGIRE